MATYDSAYYYKRYKTKKSEVKDYDSDIKALEKIRNAMTNNMYDEIRNVNNEIDALKEDMAKAVRYNAAFTRETNNLPGKKEKAVTADTNLATAIRELGEEISSLTSKKNQAVSDRDYYKRKCKEKLEEEGKPSWYYIF